MHVLTAHRWARPRTTVLLMILMLLVPAATAQVLSREIRTNLISATVQVIPWDDVAADFVMWSGSGTIISQDGYVLTNYHVIGDMAARQHYEWHGIFMTDVKSADLAPELNYWARYVAGDPLLDLAILRIEEYPDESPVPAGTVFPAVPVGDSHSLLPGDGLTVVGYPGISGATITFTQGIMSGWLGEDQVAGGRQWIKTDAKIAGGNSGGAAVNDRGELIGIPTAGYHTLDGAVYEEQLYVRPIALAWALIGPHVANVVRPDTVTQPVTATQPVQTQPVQTQPVPPQQPPATGTAVPSGNQGALAIGQTVTRTAAAASQEFITWHGYAVSVPAGQPSITVTVASDDDIDFAYSFGREILDWSDVDHLEDTPAFGGTQTIANPPAGILNIDVLNTYFRPISYSISVTGADAAVPPVVPLTDTQLPVQTETEAVPPPFGTPAQAPAGVPPFGAPAAPPFGTPAGPQDGVPPFGGTAAVNWPAAVPFGNMGVLTLGQLTPGNLLQDPESSQSTYHTWSFQVPAGASVLTVSVDSQDLLDLALKFGSEINSYAEIADGGDWHYWEWGVADGVTVMQVSAPQAGTWYLDLVNYGNLVTDGRYTVRVDVQ